MFASIHHNNNRLRFMGLSHKDDYDNYNPDAYVRAGRVEGLVQHRAHSGASVMQGQEPAQRVPYNDRMPGTPEGGGAGGAKCGHTPLLVPENKKDMFPQRFGVERDVTQDTWERPNGGRSWVR
jgi:hypothetical protein